MAGLNEAPLIQKLAIPGVAILILFLGYTSQWLFRIAGDDLSPGPLTAYQSTMFNVLLLSLLWTYYKACTVSPGRYVFHLDDKSTGKLSPTVPPHADGTPRWCKKCAAPKPPRAHHCRMCGRCIPKMDHHCPWTGNCVSLTTFPHFLRFLVYTNISLLTLGYFLALRFLALWNARHLPAYLGPSLGALIHLTLLSLAWFFTQLALAILLVSTLRNWALNTTMIESWEIERHQAIVDRSGSKGGDWWGVMGPDGERIKLERVEFPYDLSFFGNMAQAMGTRNVLLWLLPLAGGPRIRKDGKGPGWVWEENGLNDREGMWPPPQPDKARHAANRAGWPAAQASAEDFAVQYGSPEEELAAFKARQAADLRRREVQRSQIMAELEEVDDYDYDYEFVDEVDDSYDHYEQNGGGWANSEGERLRDYGVDEDADGVPRVQELLEHEDEDLPLGELLRRRNVSRTTHDDDD
jgi:palmitoyltransferase